jgi:hypothetical protein
MYLLVRSIFCIVLVSLSSFALAQRIENIRAEVIGDGEKVVITYDINGASAGQKFKITLYGSHNSYASPLSLVAGDVGLDKEILAGPNKRIEWSAKSELKDFKGDIIFEVRGEPIGVAPSQLVVESPTMGKTLKKGKNMEIVWRGGAPGENIKIELLRGGTSVSQITNGTSNQRYSWTIPKDLEKAADYQVRLTGTSGSALSGTFAIKKKTSFLLFALPVAAAGGAAALLAGGGGGGDKNLPEPPEPN